MADELLDAAMRLAERGWRVFPLRPGDKRPAVREWEARATTDPVRIRRAWTGGKWNVGVACGPSGLVVLDLDAPKDGAGAPSEWCEPGIRDGADVLTALAERHGAAVPWETYTVRTAGDGGEHLYFAAPPGAALRNTAGRLGWLVDTRAAGGYVVGAGSRIGERRYVEVLDVPAAPLPGWITVLLRAEPPRSDVREAVAAVAGRSRYVGSALRGELDRVLAAVPGIRNHTLNAAAYALGQLTGAGLLPANLAADALAEAAEAVGLPPAEAAATIRSGLAAGARRPRRVRGRAGW